MRTVCSTCGKFFQWGEIKLSKFSEIRYPSCASEFEVQSFLHHELKALGYDVRGEVACGRYILDLVVFDANRVAIRTIEVKKHRTSSHAWGRYASKERRRRIRQIGNYETIGVTLDLVARMDGARKYIGYIKEHGFPEHPVRIHEKKLKIKVPATA